MSEIAHLYRGLNEDEQNTVDFHFDYKPAAIECVEKLVKLIEEDGRFSFSNFPQPDEWNGQKGTMAGLFLLALHTHWGPMRRTGRKEESSRA